ncbi:hypothetical protein ACSQ67_024480 [Phaseolus vulgaris]
MLDAAETLPKPLRYMSAHCKRVSGTINSTNAMRSNDMKLKKFVWSQGIRSVGRRIRLHALSETFHTVGFCSTLCPLSIEFGTESGMEEMTQNCPHSMNAKAQFPRTSCCV